jgi:signal transduction histidine kinase
MVQPLAEKSLRFEFAPPPSTLTVMADGERTQQVLLNLLTNAIKFTDSGGTIHLSCESDDGMARIHVRDTGRGVPLEQRERVFEPFVQLDRNADRSGRLGVGLGLAISRDLARRMGGDVALESTVGVGSDFVLVLPLYQADAPRTIETVIEPAHPAPSPRGAAGEQPYRGVAGSPTSASVNPS